MAIETTKVLYCVYRQQGLSSWCLIEEFDTEAEARKYLEDIPRERWVSYQFGISRELPWAPFIEKLDLRRDEVKRRGPLL